MDLDVMLTPDDVHSANDLMLAIAQALELEDADLICGLRAKCSDWLQMSHERDAQLALLDAAEAAIFRMGAAC